MKLIKYIFVFIIALNTLALHPLSTNAIEMPAIGTELRVNAGCAIAIDKNTKRILYEKNPYKIVPMASTTKILTALVAMKYGNLDKKVPISPRATSISGSKVGFKKGDEIAIRELLYGLMFKSGNDAAIAIAEGISGTVEDFCKLMNRYSLEIGLLDSNFESPHGLDSRNHYSTAYDLALVTAKAKEVGLFNNISATKQIEGKDYGFTRDYVNINKILWQVPEATGVKTGFTGGAGKCLVSSFRIGDEEIIVVVLNCPDRWNESKRIYDYVAKNYEYKTIARAGEKISVSSENNAINKELLPSKSVIVPIKKGAEYSVKYVVNDIATRKLKYSYGKIILVENQDKIYEELIPIVK